MEDRATPGRKENAPITDRRSARRYLVYFPVKFEPSGGAERLGLCRDVGIHGGMVMTHSRLRPGESLRVQLYVSNDLSTARQTRGRVVRSHRRRERNSLWLFDTAVRFEEPVVDMEAELRALSEMQHRRGVYRKE